MNSFYKALFFIAAFTPFPLFAQIMSDWGFGNGGNNVEGQHLVRVHKDATGNVYQCGLFSSPSMDVDPSAATYNLSSSGLSDGFVAKYSTVGALIWAFKIGNTGYDGIYSVATDAQSNVYISGFFNNTVDFDPSPAVYNLTSNGGSGSVCNTGTGGDAFVAKYNAAGQFQWAFHVGGSYCYDAAMDISVSPGGTVYVSGNVNMGGGPVDFDPSPATHNLLGADGYAFVAKYTTNGQYVWAFNLGGAYENGGVKAIQLDHQEGALYIGGYFKGTNYDVDPSPLSTYYLSNNPEDGMLAKYDTNMNFVFAFNIPSSGADELLDIAFDADKIYTTGYVNGTNVDFDPGPGTTAVNTVSGDVYTAAYTKSGQFRWVRTAGASGLDKGHGISVAGNRVYTAGQFSGTVDFDPSPGVFNLVGAGGLDGFVQWLDTAGNFVCASGFGSSADDINYHVLGYAGNKLLMGGAFQQTVQVAAQNISSNGMSDIFLSNCTWNSCNAIITDTIINRYAAVLGLEPCTNKITVDTATDFNVGDTVLMIQMKGAVIDSSNTAAFGTVTDYTGAGNYEYNVIKAKSGNVLTLKHPVVRDYDIPDGKVQIVRVPSSLNYTVNQPHTAMPWNGNKGGVFAIYVANTLTLNDNIQVNEKGFKGGTNNQSATQVGPILCTNPNYYMAPNYDSGSMKGEGIAEVSLARSYGRGKLANGGGGGNAHNAGGGGGSNGGAGGLGGNEYYGCGSTSSSGIGGTALAYSNVNNKIFLGGGGGSAQANNLTVSNGGSGGGICIITAGVLIGNNKKISADGKDALQCVNNGSFGACHDGSAGGGAAGTILVNATISGTLNLDAKGGKGANEAANGSYGEVGPGGGGSGGVLWIKPMTIPGTLTNNVVGGANGMILYNNVSWGAQPGQPGLSITGLVLNFPADTFYNTLVTDFSDSVVNCFTRKFRDLSVTTGSGGIVSWSWSFGSMGSSTQQNPTFTFPGYGTFPVTLRVTNGDGCIDSITQNITIPYVPFADAGNDTTICAGSTARLQASGGVSYSWSPAAGLSDPSAAATDATVSGNTAYIVTVTDNKGCTDKDTVVIGISNGAAVAIVSDDNIITGCLDNPVQLQATGSVSYTWSPGGYCDDSTSASPRVKPPATTLFTVRGTDAGGCVSYDTVTVSVYYGSKAIFMPNAFSPNGDGRNDEIGPFILCGFTMEQFAVFNRWGQQVFSAADPSVKWNGTYKNKPADTGTYYYFIKGKKGDGTTTTFKGDLTLIR